MSRNIQLERGVRQGCPLSPLLFALAIEPLAIRVHLQETIKCIQDGNEQAKTALRADDIVCFLSRPLSSIRELDNITSQFSLVSGYKVNRDKSLLMGINVLKAMKCAIFDIIPAKWAKESVTYLGVKLCTNYN